MNIIELLSHVGAENIQVQNVMHNLVRVDNPKHHQCSKITVTISPEIGQEISAAVFAEQPPRTTGLILWIPTDKLPLTK